MITQTTDLNLILVFHTRASEKTKLEYLIGMLLNQFKWIKNKTQVWDTQEKFTKPGFAASPTIKLNQQSYRRPGTYEQLEIILKIINTTPWHIGG